MHFLKNRHNKINSFRYDKHSLLGLYGLLCVSIFLKGLILISAIGLTSAPKQISQWNAAENLPTARISAPQQLPVFFLDFEVTSEIDPDSDDSDEATEKDDTCSASLSSLLSHIELSRTKSTLESCTNALQKRITIPFFILYHAWKDYPA